MLFIEPTKFFWQKFREKSFQMCHNHDNQAFSKTAFNPDERRPNPNERRY